MVIILSLGYAGISLLSPIYEGKMLGFLKILIKPNIKYCFIFSYIKNYNRNSY